MTKETKNTVSAETIVENLKEFVNKLHDDSKGGMVSFLLMGDMTGFKVANDFHKLSHELLDILDGKSVKEVLEEADENEEDSSLVRTITINVKTGKVEGIDGIKDTKVKEQILAAVSKVVEELGGN